jgi:ATP-dependent helicase HepA
MTNTRSTPAWAPGDQLTHRFNPELGIGRVTALDGRTIVVEFPTARTTLRLAASTDALVPVDPNAGAPPLERALFDRLARGELDDARDFLIRLDVLRLRRVREADGLGSFLGGRVRLFPHQLYVAERATGADPVRWLLADEVGLGKTIEACLILNRLVHTRRIERCLVVAPASLTVQWLGELWRKYHQVFTLLDDRRLADVEKDFGAGFNPFDLHRRAVIALETLTANPQLTAQAVAAGIDLLVVDEAQRLRRPPGHPGEPPWRAVAPIAAQGRHVLLLSATPLEDDAHGFFRLLQLLRPDDFPEDLGFEARLTAATPLPPCTSSTRRVDIGGLPPRVGVPVVIDDPARWRLRETVETSVRTATAANPVARRQKSDRIRRALASGAALAAVLGPDERALREQAQAMDASDPRLDWLLAQAPRWREAREKTLVFVAHRETLEMLRTALSHRGQLATGAFHEELPPPRRDLEVARFREAAGPSLLISTEAGGEGRNFEFCRRLVLFDLPWKPSVVEQRIGRLDRIGRRLPVEIVYFRPPRGIGADAARLFESLGLFREPLAGVEPELAQVESTLDAVADDPSASLPGDACAALVADVGSARTRIREAAFQQLHRHPYRADMAAGLLARVPADLDALNQDVVVAACTRLGFHVEHTRGRRIFAIELGTGALVDSLPGVRSGSAYVGSFDREEAVEDETVDFFASGHPLVEGILAHFEDGLFGRVARLEIQTGLDAGEGLAAVYKDGPDFEVIAFDASGRSRPEWAAALRDRPRRITRATGDVARRPGWTAMVQRLARRLDPARTPHAVAALVVRPV